jgi:hypothetical protein
VSDEYSSRRGDELLARILAGDDTGTGTELLNECWRGYPVERLSALLRSDDESAVKAGVFITSELAGRSRPLLNDVKPLLNHPNTWVRTDAIDTVNLAATADDAEIVARAIERITDSDRSVGDSAFTLLAAADRDVLEASWGYLHDVDIKEGLRSVLDGEATVSSAAIRSRLADDSQLVRLFGLLSAARISDRRADDLLAAIEADNEEIQLFAFREARRRRLVPPTKFEDRGGS